MFGQLIESIRSVVEGEGGVDQIDKYSRQRSKGNKYLKQRASKLRRRGTKEKLRKGDYDKLRDRVTKGWAS